VKRPVRIVIVDHHPAFRELLRSALQQIPGLELVGEASDGLEAVQKYQELRPDLILSDLGLPELNGIEVVRQIRAVSAEAKSLIVSTNRSWAIVQEAFRAGAGGYLVKFDMLWELESAVNSVLMGIPFISTRVERF
jgi:DNA-binding NarL/FixJ family response regulator